MISDWVLLVLKSIASKKVGPTFASRWLFILTQIIYDGYQYGTGGGRNIDMFPLSYNDKYVNNIETWMNMVCDLACELVINNIGDTYIPLEYKKNKIDIDFSAWASRANTYINNRNTDGWIESKTISGTIPNQNQDIPVSTPGIPILENYDNWTSLFIDSKKQSYLTPEWGNVTGTVTNSELSTLLGYAYNYYPKSEIDWDIETGNVLDIYNNLNDKQRMSAEFWAGGPGSVTPPGFWFIFAYCMLKSKSMDLHFEVKTYTLLGMGVFQAGICAWKLKREKLQARPIQRIRYLNSGSIWMPYQESSFVTPPFPDFVSGHSTFSSTCSRILYKVFKNQSIDLDTIIIESDNLKLLSPSLFSTTDNNIMNLSQINILPGKSTVILDKTTPLSGCKIGWASLDDMADDAGNSRIYGGIHVESSNQAGLSMGREIASLLCNKYKSVLDFVYSPSASSGFRVYKNV